MGRPARPRAVHGRAGHSLTVPHPWLGSQYCLRAAQAQSGRSKKLKPAQRCSSAFNASSQLSRGSAGISVIRRVGTGAGAGAGWGVTVAGVSVSGVSACGARAGASTVGVDGVAADAGGAGSRSDAWRGSSGALSACSCPRPGSGCGAVAATARGWRPTRRCAPGGCAPVHDQQHERAVDRQGIERGERGPAHAPAGDGRGVLAAKQAAPAYQRGPGRADQPPGQAPERAGRARQLGADLGGQQFAQGSVFFEQALGIRRRLIIAIRSAVMLRSEGIGRRGGHVEKTIDTKSCDRNYEGAGSGQKSNKRAKGRLRRALLAGVNMCPESGRDTGGGVWPCKFRRVFHARCRAECDPAIAADPGLSSGGSRA